MASTQEPLDVLIELTRVLATERSLEDALQATSNAALEVLPGDHASLRLFNDDRRELLSTARAGAGSSYRPMAFRSGFGVLGAVADSGKAALVTDTRTDPRFEEAATGFEVRSLVAVPLNAGGRVVGVLSTSSREPNVFTERDRDLAQLLANCTAPAIETARLARLAVTDDLTRAYNQRYLGPRLAEEVGRSARYGHPLSVLMMDLDHFKQVNDVHGHPVGDQVLRAFVGRVNAEVRQPDVLVRRGGEEFLLLMPDTDIPEAVSVAERIRVHVGATPFEMEDGLQVPVSVSIGVAAWAPNDSPESLEGRADEALYAAKRTGRDRVEVQR
ncbi:MAG: diguanylate cyclase [Sandaracinaceae bacterium]